MSTRFQAKFRGETLGWFDTAREAQNVLDAAQQAHDAEEAALFGSREAAAHADAVYRRCMGGE